MLRITYLLSSVGVLQSCTLAVSHVPWQLVMYLGSSADKLLPSIQSTQLNVHYPFSLEPGGRQTRQTNNALTRCAVQASLGPNEAVPRIMALQWVNQLQQLRTHTVQYVMSSLCLIICFMIINFPPRTETGSGNRANEKDKLHRKLVLYFRDVAIDRHD